MKTYIGTKIVQAEPEERDGQEGFAVVYADGYRSWSPRATFEETYRLISGYEANLVAAGAEKG